MWKTIGPTYTRPLPKGKGVLVVFALMMAVSGCAHRTPAVDNGAAAQGQAFLTQLKAVPAAKRPDYIKDHPDGVKSIVASRDKNLMLEYQGVIRSGR